MKNATSYFLQVTRRTFCILVLLLVSAVHVGAGNVVGWGNNTASQIRIPTNIGLSAISVAAGGAHSLTLKNDGTVLGWGFNLFRQRDVPVGLSNVVAIAGGEAHSLALLSNGTVIVWGNHPQAPPEVANAVEIAAGRSHSLARLANGKVVSWGSLTNVPLNITNPVNIAAGDGYSLALQADGRVIVWGLEKPVVTQLPGSLTNIVAVAAGYDHALALQDDGRVVAWGANGSGQCNVPEGLTGVVRITAGAEHSLCLKWDSTLTAWGATNFNQVPALALTNCTSISAGAHHNLAVRGDGAPILFVHPRDTQVVLDHPGALRVLASGALPLKYQWQKDGANIAGATTSSLNFAKAQLADEGMYRVIITNLYGQVTSSEAWFHPVGEPPTISKQPANKVALCGSSTSFTVSAEGNVPIKYQWYYEGNAISSATSTSLAVSKLTWTNAGFYWVVVSNPYGSTTSTWASLSVESAPSTITSALTATGKLGYNFNYKITGLNTPMFYSISNIPPGLVFNPTNGVISGSPSESGTFGTVIGCGNLCAWDYRTLVISVGGAIPQIAVPDQIDGMEGQSLTYQIATTEPATGFTAQGLPPGLLIDYESGQISGTPLYAGQWEVPITASNEWSVAEATLRFVIANADIPGLSLDGLTPIYSSPYLMDFEFTLRTDNDPKQGKAFIVEPRLLSATCLEDEVPISSYETASFIAQGSSRVSKTFMVLDYTLSIASLKYGDSDNDGISDAIEAMETNAVLFVERQHPSSQIGIYEFHREDEEPNKVSGLTVDHASILSAISGIWTNYVKGYPGGSRAWDAVGAAVTELGAANPDETHSILLISDGRDESSTTTFNDLSNQVMTAKASLYVLGFGEATTNPNLGLLCTNSGGRFYAATNVMQLVNVFDSLRADFLGRYILRWTTLKRGNAEVHPSFRIHYGALTAESPFGIDSIQEIVDTNASPATTNYLTNWFIKPYVLSNYVGTVSEGRLRLVPESQAPSGPIILRSMYTPRHVQQFRVHYRPNWPCKVELMSARAGEILEDWSLSQTNDGSGGYWLSLDTPYRTNEVPFGAFGNLLRFSFKQLDTPSNAFSLFEIDNSVYPAASKITMTLDAGSAKQFTTFYAALPKGTPVPWLKMHGIPGDPAQAELSDLDGDGIPAWQEYLAGTDPAVSESGFLIRQVSMLADGRRQITFTTSPGKTYRVDGSEDLVNWRRLWEKVPGTGQPITFRDNRYDPNVQQMYYRVLVY